MDKLDLVKEQKEFYRSPKKAVAVKVPKMKFIMCDGARDPEAPEGFARVLPALYGTAYTLKFMMKAAGQDYKMLPLEAMWWPKSGNWDSFETEDRDDWLWTTMIRVPDFVGKQEFNAAVKQLREKKNPEALDEIRFESFTEGHCAQILHIGPYDTETENIARMHALMKELGKRPTGKHHEIYISDPEKTAPEKLKTVLRQAMG